MSQLIRVLPPDVANRIAAGEVVERPASIVKELVENALDAGATRLLLDLEAGGTRLVRLRDDGDGMSAQDLAVCVQSHATSKISVVEDLFRVASFGFRGEALPSIAAVCELQITTRQPSQLEGQRMRWSETGQEGPMPAAAPPGTTVEVRNLFCSVPARRKFLKQERWELSQCLEAVTRLMLPEPEVSMRVTHNGREVMDVASAADLPARLRSFFGPKLGADLLVAREREGADSLQAYFGPASLVKGTARYQYVFLNGRFIRDRSIFAAVREAYRGLIMPREHPVVFLFLQVDPAEVDVNVHPTKTEVRFRNRDRIFRLVSRTLKQKLLEVAPEQPLRSGSGTWSAPATKPGDLATRVERELFAGGIPSVGPQEAAAGAGFLARDESGGVGAPATCEGGVWPEPRPLTEGGIRFQVHRSYIVVETQDGLAILDQHALHERKLFEELLLRFEQSQGEDQPLLVPEVVDLSAADAALLLSRTEELQQWGIQLAAFGSASVCIQSLPCSISQLSAACVVEELLEALGRQGSRPASGDLLRKVVASLACRAAVKFHDALADSEIESLVSWWQAHPELRNCPHGRPVALGLSLRELELRFKRKV